MKLRLKKINVLRLGFFFSTLYASLAIIIAVPMTLILPEFGWWMIILLPLLYGVGGFIGGLIMGGLYNLITKWIGGLEFEFEEIEKFTD